MVLGWIVYEAIDIIYFTGKLGYNGVSRAYNWYYSAPDEEDDNKKSDNNGDSCCQREMIEELKKLNAKIALIECNSRIDNKID